MDGGELRDTVARYLFGDAFRFPYVCCSVCVQMLPYHEYCTRCKNGGGSRVDEQRIPSRLPTMSQDPLTKLLAKMTSLMHWKRVEAIWRDDANNPYAPGWYLELHECYFHFELKHYIVRDARATFDSYADHVSANALNRYGHLELTLRDDPSVRKTKGGDKRTTFTQESPSSTTQDYYEVPLAGSGWQSGCRRF